MAAEKRVALSPKRVRLDMLLSPYPTKDVCLHHLAAVKFRTAQIVKLLS